MSEPNALQLTVFDTLTQTIGTNAVFNTHRDIVTKLQFTLNPDWQKQGYQSCIDDLHENTVFSIRSLSSSRQKIHVQQIEKTNFIHKGQPGIRTSFSIPVSDLKRYWSILRLLYSGLWKARKHPELKMFTWWAWFFIPYTAIFLTQHTVENQCGRYEITASYKGSFSNSVTITITQDNEL